VWIHPDRAGPLDLNTGDRIKLTNSATGQSTGGTAYVTRLVRRDTLFIYSSFGSENKALSRAYGVGTATSKLIPYRVEPVVAGFRSQEFTIKVSKVEAVNTAMSEPPLPGPYGQDGRYVAGGQDARSHLPEGEGELARFANLDSEGGAA
jgi:hypothetical protein